MSPFFAALLACSWMGAVFLVTGWQGRAARVNHPGPHQATREHAK
jgi:hypothetical protein